MSAIKKWSQEAEDYLCTLMTSSWTNKEVADKINAKFGTSYTRCAVGSKIYALKGKRD